MRMAMIVTGYVFFEAWAVGDLRRPPARPTARRPPCGPWREGPAMSVVAKRVLVTGGAGFLGSHLCERLLAQGDDVLCVDNYFTGRKDNVALLLGDPHFEVLRHDITHPRVGRQRLNRARCSLRSCSNHGRKTSSRFWTVIS